MGEQRIPVMAEIEFIQKSCSCGFAFMVPKSFDRQRQNNHKSFFCPACGMERYYPQENKEEKLRKSLDNLKASYGHLEGSRDRETARLEHEIRVRTGYQGQVAKLKRQLAVP